MTTHYNTNVSNENNNICKQEFNIWLVNSQGDIFIKHLSKNNSQLSIKHLTFVADDSKDLLLPLESIWYSYMKILSFKECYRFVSDSLGKEIVGYVLELDLAGDQQVNMETMLRGKFVGYRDIDSILSKDTKDNDCLEAYITVIDALDKVHGVPNSDICLY